MDKTKNAHGTIIKSLQIYDIIKIDIFSLKEGVTYERRENSSGTAKKPDIQ